MPYLVENGDLKTDRLLVRRPVAADMDIIVALLGDPDVMRTYGAGRPFDRTATRKWVEKIQEHHRDYGYGAGMISLDSGETIGLGGISRGSMSEEVLFGCVLAKHAWGRGYALELGIATLDYGFSHVGLQRIEAITPASNAPAVALATKLDMSFDGRFVQENVDYVRFAKHSNNVKGPSQP